MTVRIKVNTRKNDSLWKSIVRNLSRRSNYSANVGWWKTRYPDGVSVAQVAQWNEEGHMNGGMFAGTYTPPRPFIRVGFMKNMNNMWLKRFFPQIHNVAMGKITWAKLHEMIAKAAVPVMRETIIAWKTPPNSAATIKLKGSNNPLIDSGLMLNSVEYMVGTRRRR